MADRNSVRLSFSLDDAALARAIAPTLRRRIGAFTRRTATQARSDVPVRTGNLGRSIVEDPIVQTGPFRFESGVTATASYAAAVHEGSRPHVIRPRQANVLRFKVGSRTVFADMVRHPGTWPRPFLRNAAERVAADMGGTLD